MIDDESNYRKNRNICFATSPYRRLWGVRNWWKIALTRRSRSAREYIGPTVRVYEQNERVGGSDSRIRENRKRTGTVFYISFRPSFLPITSNLDYVAAFDARSRPGDRNFILFAVRPTHSPAYVSYVSPSRESFPWRLRCTKPKLKMDARECAAIQHWRFFFIFVFFPLLWSLLPVSTVQKFVLANYFSAAAKLSG